MSTITKLEEKVLKAIRDNEYQDGVTADFVVNNPVWVFSVSYDVGGTKVFSGVMSSLTKKNLAGTDKETCWITKEGFERMEDLQQ